MVEAGTGYQQPQGQRYVMLEGTVPKAHHYKAIFTGCTVGTFATEEEASARNFFH